MSTFVVALLLSFAGFLTDVQAQNEARTQATVAYNEARELVSGGNFDQGIARYIQALSTAESAECEECSDIVELVEGQIPRVYFSRASNAFNEFRSDRSAAAADQAIAYFQEAAEIGQEFGDEQVAQQSTRVIPQIHYNKSLAQYQQEDFDGALASLNRAIELNANYTLAYYQRAIVLNNNGSSLDDIVSAFEQAIQVGESVGEADVAARARTRLGEELLYRGTNSLEEEQVGEAIELFTQAEQYIPEDADLHYRFAEAYNNQGDASSAIEHAEQALELENGGVTARAKIYYELGRAYMALDQVSNACSAFEDASYGDFQGPAQYEIEHNLECNG